ncbi:MAG: outer membrane protein assembly factor BamD [Marinicellaceae bacterium]
MKKIYSLCFLLVLLTGITACKKSDKKESVEVTRFSAETLYNKSKKYLDLEIWDNAILYYNGLRNQYPFGRYAEQGSLELAYAYYRSYDMELAISTLDRFIKNYPAHEHLDYAYYLKGLIFFESERGLFERVKPSKSIDRNQENAKQAFLSFKTFIEKFPNSDYASDAELRMLHIRNKLAAYELQVAKYYMRRQAYVGAINRCKYVIESFQKSDSVAESIAVMAEAYKRLGQEDLAESSLKVLKTNYPNHAYLQGEDLNFETKLFSLSDLWIFSKKAED